MYRKQAYRWQVAAQDWIPVKSDENDECVVEYDSDDDKHGDSANAKVDTEMWPMTMYMKKSITDKGYKTEDVIQDVAVDKMSEQSVGENIEIENKESEHDQKLCLLRKEKWLVLRYVHSGEETLKYVL